MPDGLGGGAAQVALQLGLQYRDAATGPAQLGSQGGSGGWAAGAADLAADCAAATCNDFGADAPVPNRSISLCWAIGIVGRRGASGEHGSEHSRQLDCP